MAEIRPMEQFMVHKLVSFAPFNVGGLSVDLSITNSVATMMGAALLICVFFVASAQGKTVPGRLQAFGEILYDLVDKTMTGPMIGDRGRPFLPYVFALFCLIALLNIWGIVPGSFTVTSQLAVTITLAVVTFGMVIVVGFIRNGFGFFKLFVPSGVHWVMLLMVVPIEFISFMVRPITLSMRLFGNMIGGHVVLYMFGSFVVAMAVFAMQGGFAYLGFVGSALSLATVVALSALELIVAFLQAFVFAALTCTYLSDVVNLDHGH
ncbi:MAG TPA: F0F1 ATP synthase subunit A [Caulobacteraceae bacterium]|jgi:F-type H+-transporting ATPase subunit a|nr:F0F1 ATP synthase subunit A [Caulobacteraceae bacterium]